MVLPFGRRLTLFTATAVLATTATTGAIGYGLLDRGLTRTLQAQLEATHSTAASRISAEIEHLSERAKLYANLGASDPLSLNLQHQYFADQDELLGLSLLKAPSAPSQENGGEDPWKPVFRWSRPHEDPSHLSANDFEELELKFPVDFEKIKTGTPDLVHAEGPEESPVLRLALPYGTKSETGYTQALVIETKATSILSKLKPLEARPEVQILLADSSGRLIASNVESLYSHHQDISLHPALRQARSTGNSHGHLEFHHSPNTPLEYASFERIPWGGTSIWVISQVSRQVVTSTLRVGIQISFALGIALALLCGAWATWASSRWISIPLSTLRAALEEHWPALGGRSPKDTPLPPETVAPLDEIERLAITLEIVCEDMDKLSPEQREKLKSQPQSEAAPPSLNDPWVKFKDPMFLARIESGEIPLEGARFDALVLCARLNQLEKSARDSDPKALVNGLNDYHRRCVEAIEARGGIVDHVHSGTLVAYWGVPEAQPEDTDHALEASQLIRAAASACLKTPVTLALHRGPLIAGQVGAPGRLEYSAVGEAIETSERIAAFADQFGTDLVLTAAAAEKVSAHYSTERLTAGDDQTPELYEVSEALERSAA